MIKNLKIKKKKTKIWGCVFQSNNKVKLTDKFSSLACEKEKLNQISDVYISSLAALN